MVNRVAQRWGQEYSRGLIARFLGIFFCVIVALKLSPYAIYAIGPLLLLASLQKRAENSLITLILLSALSVINEVVVEKGFNFYLMTRGALFVLAIAMSLKAGFQKSVWFMAPFYWLFAYVFYMMVTSFVGWAPLVSELKALLFLVFISALSQSVAVVSQTGVDIRTIRAAMLVVALFYLAGSVAVIPFPSIGQSMMYAKMEAWGGAFDPEQFGTVSLFNGLSWHSQTLGPLVALLNAFVLSDYLCNFRRSNWLYRVLLVCAPILVYISSSRTALFAYLVSLASSLFFFMRERRVGASRKSQVLIGAFAIVMLAALVIVARPHGLEQAEAFLRKTHEFEQNSESLTESLTKSRMGLVEKGLSNFRESPLIGNGFQVSEEMRDMGKADSKILLSAPIEKGVLPIMVLEEGGAIGAILFGCFILSVYVKYSRLRFSCFLSCFTVFIALNTGEASFFSTSGSGGILWMICFCALLMDIHRLRRELAEAQMQATNRPVPLGY